MTGQTVHPLSEIAVQVVAAVVLALLGWLLVRAQAYIAAHTNARQRQTLADLTLQICGAAEQEYRRLPDSGANKFSWADGKLHNALPKLTEAQRKTLIEDAVRAINASVVTLTPYLASGAGAAGLTPLAAFAAPLASVVAHGVADIGVGGLDVDALKADMLGAVGALARQEVAAAAPGALVDAFARLATAASPPDPAPAPPLPSASAKTLHIVESTNHDDVVGVVIQPLPAGTVAEVPVNSDGEQGAPVNVLPLTPPTPPTPAP